MPAGHGYREREVGTGQREGRVSNECLGLAGEHHCKAVAAKERARSMFQTVKDAESDSYIVCSLVEKIVQSRVWEKQKREAVAAAARAAGSCGH